MAGPYETGLDGMVIYPISREIILLIRFVRHVDHGHRQVSIEFLLFKEILDTVMSQLP